MNSLDFSALVEQETIPKAPTLLPEISLRLAPDIEALWRKMIQLYNAPDLSMPFWAAAWPGGVGLARYVLDHPETFRGKRVLDFAAGSGVVAIAAAKAGAAHVQACDIDAIAHAAITQNFRDNVVTGEIIGGLDLLRPYREAEIILAGDICYEPAMSVRAFRWLRENVATGAFVLMGDPARAYAPTEGVEPVKTYVVPVDQAIESCAERVVRILAVQG